MNILIPLADGHKISKRVMLSICMQNVDCDIYVVSRPGPTIATNYPHSRHVAQCENMNLLKQYASSPFTVYMDGDVELGSPCDISDMCTWLANNEVYDAVALNTKNIDCLSYKEQTGHVIIACMCIRKLSLDTYTFKSYKHECPCINLNRNLKIKYLDDRRLYEVK
jgi:hypothetical protein